MNSYALGLDYGTNSVRCLIVRTRDGSEVAAQVTPYSTGDSGVILDPRNPDVARQHPMDYLHGATQSIRGAIAIARVADSQFLPERVVGIGVDTTGSTPIPVDAKGRALAESPRFMRDPNALAWLWKDHTSTSEAIALTQAALEEHPEYLAKCGGVYSSEWFWSKIWHCAEVAPQVAEAAHSWVELADWIPAILSGTESSPVRGICAAGHKAMYHRDWGGYPDRDFLGRRHPYLAQLRNQLGTVHAQTIAQVAGRLTSEWAARTGLSLGIPIATGAIDAHLGAVGSGIAPGVLVKILGTSTCDILAPFRKWQE